MLHIAVVTTDPAIPKNRASFIRELRTAGHKIDIVLVGKAASDETRRTLASGRFPGDYRPDLLLLFCVAYIRIHLLPWLKPILQGYPYVTLWDSNPLRSLHFLNQFRDNHLGLYVLDTQIVHDLRELGFHQSSYLPYYYADPEVFRPRPVRSDYHHDVALAGTYFFPSMQDRLFSGQDRIHWGHALTEIAAEFQQTRAATGGYVDVYRFLRGRIDCGSKEGVELSQHLMYVQKWMEREALFSTLSCAGLDCHVYGGNKATAQRPKGSQAMLPGDSHLHVHDFIDKHSDLPALYSSTTVNLCCTQFPRAAHERVFQAAGCGAFLLHEWKEDVPALFEPGREIVLYRRVDELPELIRFYVRHESERRRIAERARARFLKDHTPNRRAEEFGVLLQNCVARHRDVQTSMV